MQDRMRVLEAKLTKADIMATVILPNVIAQNQALKKERCLEQEAVAEQLAAITTNFTQKIMTLENRCHEQTIQAQRFQHEIRVLNQQLVEQINATNAERATNERQFRAIHERDEIISGFERQLEDVTRDNEQRIEAEVQVS